MGDIWNAAGDNAHVSANKHFCEKGARLLFWVRDELSCMRCRGEHVYINGNGISRAGRLRKWGRKRMWGGKTQRIDDLVILGRMGTVR